MANVFNSLKDTMEKEYYIESNYYFWSKEEGKLCAVKILFDSNDLKKVYICRSQETPTKIGPDTFYYYT